MQKRNFSDKTMEAVLLLAMTLGLMVFGILRRNLRKEHQALPSDEESSKELSEEEAVTPRELNAEDFQKAKFEYIYSDWDDEHTIPYFHVNTGWYYLTGDMAQPELMKEGKSIYLGNGDCLKQIDPKTPEKGVCHLWK